MNRFARQPSKRGRAPTASLLFCLLPVLLAPTLFTPPSSRLASAQVPHSPLPVSAPAVARTATKLYVVGGNYTNTLLSQFYSLDLAVPWNETQPAWTRLADGPKQELFPAVFSADGKALVTFHSGTLFAMRYSVDTNTWTSAACRPAINFQGVGAVTDPNTGLAYLAAGYTGRRDTMSVYNFVTDKLSSIPGGLPVADGLFRARAYYGNAWCKYRNSILYFGGYDTAMNIIPENVVTEYRPETNAWSTMITSGAPPPMRADHCMAANDDGTKIVIFGGRLSTSMGFLNDLYILDTVTQTWRQGAPGPTRVYAACTVAGNQLLLWGGLNEAKNRVDATVHVYNFDLNTWGSSYTPPASYLNSAKTPSGADSGEGERDGGGHTSSGSNVAAITGGVAGGLLVILAAVLFVFYRRKRGNNRPRGTKLIQSRETEESHGADRNGELQHLRVRLENQQEELELHRRLLQLQQQQQEQQQQMQQMQQRQQQGRPLSSYGQPTPVSFAPIATDPSDPYRVVAYAYTGDSMAPAMNAAAEVSSSSSSMGYHHLPTSTPSSPIYAAHPYQPIPLSPSPGPSVPISAVSVSSSAYNSVHNSAAPSRVNSVHVGGSNQEITTNNSGQGGIGSQRDPPKPSGPRGNPQHGARER